MEEKLTITAIEPQKKKKDRYNIYADGEYLASLGAEAVVRTGLKTGSVISLSELQSAVLEDNIKYAFDCAVTLLSHSMRTHGELVQRLRERDISDDAIEPAMDKLASYGYVDDTAYAREYVRSAVSVGRLGRLGVRHRLQDKKLERAVIDDAMDLYSEEDELGNARRLFEGVKSKANGDAKKIRQKAFAMLTQRGFLYDTISALFSEADE